MGVGLEDSGLLDIYLGSEHPDADNGLDITLVLENADEQDRESFFKLKRVDVEIDGFEIGIRESAHPIRNWLARGAVRSFMEIKIKQVVSYLLHIYSLCNFIGIIADEKKKNDIE